MVEPSRKHGPFDRRYPARPKLAAPSWELRPDEDGAPRLDWSVFLARYFSHRRRHDFEALAAYEAYRNRLEQGPSQQRSPRARPHLDQLRGGPVPGQQTRLTAEPAAVLSAAVLGWESEGGAAAEPVAS